MRNKFKELSKYFLFIGYLTILLPIILYHSNLFGITIVGRFLFFILCGFIFYFFRIDSRYLIFPAILLLWFCPFLLIYKLNSIAEMIVIYLYISLVVGAVLQLVELKLNYNLYVPFESIKNVLFNKNIPFLNIICAVFFLISYFLNLGNIAQAITLYFSSTLLIAYNSQYFLDLNK